MGLRSSDDSGAMSPQETYDLMKARDEWKARAEKAEAEVARLRAALREIAVGRTSVDNDGPLDPFTSMAGRFLSIAQDALRGCGS